MDKQARILVVDDEKGIREGCKRILASEGYIVDVAENGKIGLELVKVNPYDLLIIDLMMPIMGGLEMMSHVRDIDPEVIMIVITGFATIETAVDAIKHGAYDYIPKPFTPDGLIAVVNRGLETRRLRLETKRLKEERDEKLLELASEKSKMHAIINSMADGVFVVNKENQLVLWNPAFIRMLNINGQIEPGKSVEEIITNERLLNVIKKAYTPDSSRYTTITEEIDLPPPEAKSLMVNVSIIRDDESNQELGLVGTLRDITRLKELDKLKSQFVAMVTHELRAPVSAIEGYLTAFLTGAAGNDPKMYRQMMERARQRARSLLDLINDLLEYSRLEAKSPVRKKELLDISSIIVNTVELLKGQSGSKDLKFEVDVPESLPLIEADKKEMEQLLTNLISNAIKYNVKNGKVIVSARPNKHFLNIIVADTGIGIDAEHLPHIFDEFYRVSCPETRYTTGTGLGLSIVKKIVESHFGRIDVESTPNKGTTFTVKLPIKQKK